MPSLQIYALSGNLNFTILPTSSGIVGQLPYCDIQRLSDDYYLVSGTWQTSYGRNLMSEKDSTNQPGLYTYPLNQGVDTYYVGFHNVGVYAVDQYETYQVVRNYSILGISGDIKSIIRRMG